MHRGLPQMVVEVSEGGKLLVAIQWVDLEANLIETRTLQFEEGTCCCFQVQRSAVRSAECLLLVLNGNRNAYK